MVVVILLLSLGALALAYLGVLLAAAFRRHALRPPAETVALGALTNFFDTLGIGSFAPTTAWLKLRGLVPDSFLPATLNSGHALPTVAQALIFIHLVRVDPLLLVGCIAAAVAGATDIGRSAEPGRTAELRSRGIVAYPEDLGVRRIDAKRSLLAARSIEDLVAWSGGLYAPPARFRSW